jgi:aspartyl aminopeptidase
MDKMDTIQGLFSFIAASPTSFHAVANAEASLRQAGFSQLLEGDTWDLTPGKGYYVTRNQSSLIAFRVPETISGFLVGAAHTDSPCFKLKENMELRPEGYTRLDAEKYGGMLIAPWLDRPLSVAGRLMVATEAGVSSVLVNLDRDLLVIPSLAIHMDRTANDGKKWDAQVDLLPLLGKGDRDLLPYLAAEAGVTVEDILSFDLFAYNRDRGTVLGAEGEFILCPRLDDLQCVYGLLQGFLRATAPRSMPVLCLFDNEEVGSETRQGAMSTFLCDTLRRVCLTQGMGEEAYLRCVAQSLMVSADNAHGVHPGHPEKAALTNRPKLGEGVVIKYGARYATDSASAALMRQILRKAQVPEQVYFNHSNVAGGGTLGNISGTQVSMHTVDIGLAQLAMHSACETAGTADTDYLIRAMEACFSARLTETAPEHFTLEL